ncbi:DUF4124 domain-containing protein [Pseudomonas agarici]|nr:DUF4124 domain-containing protein [Pseudomonas agarici]
MKWTSYLALAAFCTTIVQAADVYKCTTPDGRVVFSNSGCGTASGSAEQKELKINNMGGAHQTIIIRATENLKRSGFVS